LSQPGAEPAGCSQPGARHFAAQFHEDEAEALRLRAFKDRRSESAIVREAVRAARDRGLGDTGFAFHPCASRKRGGGLEP
jgi:hypothetical protein